MLDLLGGVCTLSVERRYLFQTLAGDNSNFFVLPKLPLKFDQTDTEITFS